MTTTKEATPSEERRLAELAVVVMQRRERRTAKALLRSEREALARYRRTIRRVNDAAVAATMAGARAAHVVRAHTTALQMALTVDVTHARGAARNMARQHLANELGQQVGHAVDVVA